MRSGQIILRPLYWLAGKIFGTWARPAIVPESPADLFPDTNTPICYVFESGGLADTLAFERLARKHGLISPTAPLTFGQAREPNRIVVMRRKKGFFLRRTSPHGSTRLRRLVDASLAEDGRELLLVPVAIYWGRAPDKETSLLQILFSENWDFAGRTRKFFVTLFQGRNTLLSISEPLSLAAITGDQPEAEIAYRKVSRILRVHFRRRRIATVGPDLSHRRTLTNAIIANPLVQNAIEDEVASGSTARTVE